MRHSWTRPVHHDTRVHTQPSYAVIYCATHNLPFTNTNTSPYTSSTATTRIGRPATFAGSTSCECACALLGPALSCFGAASRLARGAQARHGQPSMTDTGAISPSARGISKACSCTSRLRAQSLDPEEPTPRTRAPTSTSMRAKVISVSWFNVMNERRDEGSTRSTRSNALLLRARTSDPLTHTADAWMGSVTAWVRRMENTSEPRAYSRAKTVRWLVCGPQ
ncbi:hypothetical protein GGX14DRAFT_410148 [Mycena pura]|uniref:Uncharacterized protein n=1 Tax=Mycena pura TaxID=153505 RepID=A0AAD7E5K3_9AGAR|nr:hypothetical protein GGX14DRAFT_410148 [Mycena pura]